MLITATQMPAALAYINAGLSFFSQGTINRGKCLGEKEHFRLLILEGKRTPQISFLPIIGKLGYSSYKIIDGTKNLNKKMDGKGDKSQETCLRLKSERRILCFQL